MTKRGFFQLLNKAEETTRCPETILIVDDDRGIRYSLKRMFEEKGLQPITARNGREALQLLEEGLSPDLALIDIVMPGLSGLDLLEAIKEKYPRLVVIMATLRMELLNGPFRP